MSDPKHSVLFAYRAGLMAGTDVITRAQRGAIEAVMTIDPVLRSARTDTIRVAKEEGFHMPSHNSRGLAAALQVEAEKWRR